MHDNTITGTLDTGKLNITAFYANNVTFGESTIYNNTFNIANAKVLNYVLLTDCEGTEGQIKWNSTGTDKAHAGNWWGSWSETRKSPNGYLTLTAKDTELSVADLRPLVTVGQETTFKIVTGLPSGNALNLSNESQKTGTFSVSTSTAVTWMSSNTDVMTIDPAGKYEAKTVGNTTITTTSSSDSTLKATVLVTVFKPEEAKNATKSVKKDENTGNTTIETNNKVDITLSDDKKTATIKNSDSNVKLVVTYSGEATTTDTKVEGKVSSFNAEYDQVDIITPEDGAANTKVQLTITSDEEGIQHLDKLPIISPAVDEGMKQRLTTEYSTVNLAAMLTATDTFDDHMENGKITLVFTVPASWFKNMDLNSVRIYYIPTDGSGKIKEHKYTSFTPSGGNYLITVEVDSGAMCGWALGAKTKKTPVNPPISGGSSGSGNMDGSYRVLFNDGGQTVSVKTDLSAGDKLTAPTSPAKDGYAFGGWYTDEACTKVWSFSEDISGDMTLYAKWTSTPGRQTTSSGSTATAQATAKATSAPVSTTSQSASSTTAAPVSPTSASGVAPSMTQAPAPVFGALFGLLAAGILLRRKD